MEQHEKNPRPRRRSPYQRNRRLQGTWLGYLLAGTVAACLLLSVLLKDRDFSESENRKLAQFPSVSLSALADGSWFAGLGDYMADQFPGRDSWISLNLAFNRLLGQKEANGVYLCDDDYLMQVPSDPNEEALGRNLKAVNAFASAHANVNMVMCVVPNAVTVLADNCRRLGIGNITPRCGDIADVVPEVPYDAMVFCFFGGIQEILSTAKRQCDGQIFIITRNYTTHRFSVGSHKTGSYGYATTKELLEQLAIPFEEQTMELEFGQPFRSLEDARRFFETYSKDADKNAITDEFLRKS